MLVLHLPEKRKRGERAREMALLAQLGGALVSVVLKTGLERAIEQFQQIFTVPDEIKKLTTSVIRIRALLEDAEAKQVNDESVRVWLRDLKEVLLDAEDVVDEYTTDETLRSTGAETSKKVNSDIFSSFTFKIQTKTTCHQINEINERIDSLERYAETLGVLLLLPSIGSNQLGHMGWRQTSSILADTTSVIGRDREQEQIIRLVLSPTNEPESSSRNNRSFCVIPIVGMGGLGKTTLVRLVYNDKKVMNHFNIRMWICVSNEFDQTRLTKEMIDAVSASEGRTKEYHITHWELMQKKLSEEVQGKTFLLVLDDVWEVSRSQWERLFEPLNFANKGSKILITSRNINAVNIGEGRMHPVTLRGLSDDDLWLLFKRCAFDGYNSEDYIHLQRIGRQITNKLKGLPLAAKTIGYLLNTKLDVNYWRRIEKSEMWKLQQENEDGILPALGLSYQYLPGYLKRCFNYCSLFPKDTFFFKKNLVPIWDTECFSGTVRNIGMEDNSSEYFDDLLHRSFFELAPSGIDCYVMHDLMHDLAEYVSKDDFFRLEDCKRLVKTSDRIRHISLNVKKFNPAELDEFCKPEKLRTLLFLKRCEFDDTTLVLDKLFSKLKRLRVLDLSRCGIKVLPSSIGHLKHLRYINLSDNEGLEYLPDSLCDLYNLQVLELVGCSSLRALPTRMSELINLRHLTEKNGLVSKIDGLSKLTGLQEIEVRGGKVRELGGMRLLRKIKIDFLEEVGTEEEAIQARLDSKEHLQELRLGWSSERENKKKKKTKGAEGDSPSPAAR